MIITIIFLFNFQIISNNESVRNSYYHFFSVMFPKAFLSMTVLYLQTHCIISIFFVKPKYTFFISVFFLIDWNVQMHLKINFSIWKSKSAQTETFTAIRIFFVQDEFSFSTVCSYYELLISVGFCKKKNLNLSE